VLTLSKREYSELELQELRPKRFSAFPFGLHTFNRGPSTAVIDGLR